MAEFYKTNKATTPTQIDSLIVLFRLTHDNRAFDLIFKTHYVLLSSLINKTFNNYKRHLTEADYDDLSAMAYEEFYRRVMHYTIPPEAPFSGYVKMYMKQWLNSYAKLIMSQNNKYVLMDDTNMSSIGGVKRAKPKKAD